MWCSAQLPVRANNVLYIYLAVISSLMLKAEHDDQVPFLSKKVLKHFMQGWDASNTASA